MRREIFTKNEKLVKLESELQDQAAAYELQLSVLREEFGDKARKQRLSAQETEDKLQKEVDMLGKEIQEVEKFVHEKEELERARLRARADIEALNTKLEEMEAEHERRYIQGTMALKKGFEQKYDELKKRCELLTSS
jgi:septal ring factor EnvC (AmiA/AmiB activator)